jgi:hypothetical protein
MSIDPIEDILDDPDRRAKLFMLTVGAIILTTIMIAVGTIIFILIKLGVI